jgi:hypothetical protein
MGQGGRTHTCMHPDLRGAHRPSQIGAYKLVRTILSFRGGTKKSHPEQQAHGTLMGRLIKKGNAIVNETTLQFVKKPFLWRYRAVPVTGGVVQCHVGKRVAPVRMKLPHVG